MSSANLKQKISNLQKVVKEFIKRSEPSLVRRIYSNLGKRVKLNDYFSPNTLSAYRLENASNSVTSNMNAYSSYSSKKSSLKSKSRSKRNGSSSSSSSSSSSGSSKRSSRERGSKRTKRVSKKRSKSVVK